MPGEVRGWKEIWNDALIFKWLLPRWRAESDAKKRAGIQRRLFPLLNNLSFAACERGRDALPIKRFQRTWYNADADAAEDFISSLTALAMFEGEREQAADDAALANTVPPLANIETIGVFTRRFAITPDERRAIQQHAKTIDDYEARRAEEAKRLWHNPTELDALPALPETELSQVMPYNVDLARVNRALAAFDDQHKPSLQPWDTPAKILETIEVSIGERGTELRALANLPPADISKLYEELHRRMRKFHALAPTVLAEFLFEDNPRRRVDHIEAWCLWVMTALPDGNTKMAAANPEPIGPEGPAPQERPAYEKTTTLGAFIDVLDAHTRWLDACAAVDRPDPRSKHHALYANEAAKRFGITPQPIGKEYLTVGQELKFFEALRDTAMDAAHAGKPTAPDSTKAEPATKRPENPPASKWWEYPFDETRWETIDPERVLIEEVVAVVPQDSHEWKIDDPSWRPSRDNWTFIRHFLRRRLSEAEVEQMTCFDIRMALAARRLDLAGAGGAKAIAASTNTPNEVRWSGFDGEGDSAKAKGLLSHSSDFTTVTWYDTLYIFDDGLQAKAVALLWTEYDKGEMGLSEKTIGEKIGSSAANYRLDSTFRNHPAWGTMIVKVRQGVYRLKKTRMTG